MAEQILDSIPKVRKMRETARICGLMWRLAQAGITVRVERAGDVTRLWVPADVYPQAVALYTFTGNPSNN